MKNTTPDRVMYLYCISVTKLTTEDISFRQSALREFLVKEEVPASGISARIRIVCEDTCALAEGVRWRVKYFEDRNIDDAGQSHSGRPRAASTERNKKNQRTVREKRRVTVREMAAEIGIKPRAVQKVAEILDTRKFVFEVFVGLRRRGTNSSLKTFTSKLFEP